MHTLYMKTIFTSEYNHDILHCLRYLYVYLTNMLEAANLVFRACSWSHHDSKWFSMYAYTS